jgi:hypothetical protein
MALYFSADSDPVIKSPAAEAGAQAEGPASICQP